MMNSHAAKASPRCALVTPTRTIWSAGFSAPTRWMTSASTIFQRALAVSTIAPQRLFRHARIVLQRHRRDLGLVADVANGTDERRDGADGAISRAQRGKLARDVEVFRLDPNGHDRDFAVSRR